MWWLFLATLASFLLKTDFSYWMNSIVASEIKNHSLENGAVYGSVVIKNLGHVLWSKIWMIIEISKKSILKCSWGPKELWWLFFGTFLLKTDISYWRNSIVAIDIEAQK